MKSKRLCKAEQSNLDIISTLPETILEIILCFLPIDEAARTSILSRAWRYKWTKLPKLEFQLSDVYNRLSNVEEVMGSPFDEIHQILLSRTSPIHEFTLYVDTMDLCTWRSPDDFSSLEQIILHLSKNHTIKKFKLSGLDFFSTYNLPVSVFSLHHLTDLYLSCVDLNSQPAFIGFSNLKSLVLDSVGIFAETLLDLLSNSPSLKSLSLTSLVELDRSCTIIELFKCIPVIEQLTISSYVFEYECFFTVIYYFLCILYNFTMLISSAAILLPLRRKLHQPFNSHPHTSPFSFTDFFYPKPPSIIPYTIGSPLRSSPPTNTATLITSLAFFRLKELRYFYKQPWRFLGFQR